MAVSRAEKEQELQDLQSAFKASDTAILVDYKGLNVPQVTELRRQLRGAKANYKVVKNTLARRASKGTKLASLEAQFEGTTAIAYTGDDAVALAKALTAFMKSAPALTSRRRRRMRAPTSLAATTSSKRSSVDGWISTQSWRRPT